MISVSQAIQALNQGRLIAYPTEAIYGLGCRADITQSVEAILSLKQRSADKGVILIASNLQQLDDFILPLSHTDLAKVGQTWPGHTTWILPAKPNLPTVLTGGRQTLAVRITDHPVVCALCEACDVPLISTSANLSGTAPLQTPEALYLTFGNKIAGVVEGNLGGLNQASAIFDLLSGKQLR